ncbi:hypothetical protein [Microbacterium sp.]|nr:hypothetical protein [Microbacterium sp.]
MTAAKAAKKARANWTWRTSKERTEAGVVTEGPGETESMASSLFPAG